MSRDELYCQLTGYLETLFEIPPERITLDAHLVDDLDLDSIDIVDLLVKLRELTGRRVNAEEFKTVRTVGDVLDSIEKLMATDAVAID
ncbi:MAG TPA: acyl carrier protein [Rhodopila sp.]|nr:acyl carrier protein [Rhodopila sp.]